MSNDWSGTDLTDWGAWVFGSDNGIQETARLAYTLKSYSGEKIVNTAGDSVPGPSDNYGSSNGTFEENGTAAFMWSYPEASFENTVSTEYSDGVITVSFKDITNENSAGVQTETAPGTGSGIDFTDYDTVKATMTNSSDKDIRVTLVFKTGSDWLWSENGGSLVKGGTGGEMIIPAGSTVTVLIPSLLVVFSKTRKWLYFAEF